VSEPHVEEELLHRYFDGDLHAPEAASVKGHLSSCDHCTTRHLQLSALRRLITVAAEQSTLDVDFDRAFVRIERGVREQLPVGAVERAVSWIRTALAERPERLWAPALGAMAAAAVLFALGHEPAAPEVAVMAAPAVIPQAAASVAGSAAEPPAAEAAAGPLPDDALAMASSHVEQVDFGTHGGVVYDVAVADGVSTPVIWINDDPSE